MVSSRIAFFRRLYTKVPKPLNEATLSEAKQKAVSVALWEQKLTTFEDRSKFSEKIFLAPQQFHRLNFSVCGITSPSITSAGTRGL